MITEKLLICLNKLFARNELSSETIRRTFSLTDDFIVGLFEGDIKYENRITAPFSAYFAHCDVWLITELHRYFGAKHSNIAELRDEAAEDGMVLLDLVDKKPLSQFMELMNGRFRSPYSYSQFKIMVDSFNKIFRTEKTKMRCMELYHYNGQLTPDWVRGFLENRIKFKLKSNANAVPIHIYKPTDQELNVWIEINITHQDPYLLQILFKKFCTGKPNLDYNIETKIFTLILVDSQAEEFLKFYNCTSFFNYRVFDSSGIFWDRYLTRTAMMKILSNTK